MDFAHLDWLKAQSLSPQHPNLKPVQEWVISNAVELKNKGFEEMRNGRTKEAIWFFNHAIELDPRDWSLLEKR